MDIYPTREAKNIAKIYFEDKFGIKTIDGSLFSKDLKDIITKDIQRFIEGEPLQYITGKTFFYNNFFKVDESVLIPRPETELLVDYAIKNISNHKNSTILDIGTGSGCIALSIADKIPDCRIIGIDISTGALDTANQNKNILKINNVEFKQMDFLNKSETDKLGKFDMIISNPPYIDRDEKKIMSNSTLKYEPELALFPNGNNTMIFYHKIIEFAKTHLNNNGVVFCEINEFKYKEIKELLEKNGFKYQILNDLQCKPRIVQFPL